MLISSIAGLLFLCTIAEAGKGSSKFVKYYEELDYDRFLVNEQHKRVRRSAESGKSSQHLLLNFHSHGRHFNIRLVQDRTVFHEDLEIINDKGEPVKADTSHVYHGTIYGKPNSHVHGSIIDGVFTGVISDPGHGTYYVEDSEQFFKRGSPSYMPQRHHSVMYHEDQVNFPFKYGPHDTCGSSFSDIHKRMQDFQKQRSVEDDPHEHLRKKRSVDKDKTSCHLYVQTDHMLWSEFKESRDKIVAKIAEHVKAINNIYGRTEFPMSDGTLVRNIGFMVKRLKIDEGTSPDDKFYSTNIGVEKYLDLASSTNHNDFCLAYVFTQRDFDSGVLGLAWVGGVGSSGGICDDYRQYDGRDGKSLNTGIVTFENYGVTVPSLVSHITFAHEVGHNFGSPHDSGRQCTPGEAAGGNFIMYASATSGRMTNNAFFSPCSIRNISRVLEVKKDKCFERSDEPICGNAIVDEGEECDCGYDKECEEVGDINCCYPASDRENGCKLKPSVQCSVTQGPCCEKNVCSFKDTGNQCAEESDCRFSQTCDGTTARCPIAAPKDNRTTECNYGTQVCWGGECTGSICQKAGYQECDCEIPESGDKSLACQACCQPIGGGGECRSTGHPSYNEYFNGTPIYLQPGSPCDNYNGYCDMFSKCRKVDADGPLSRLKQAILNPELYRTIREWIVNYWWAVVLMSLALILLMAGFIKLCSAHTPSNNPRLPKHRQLPGAETLRRRRRAQQMGRDYGQQMRSLRS